MSLYNASGLWNILFIKCDNYISLRNLSTILAIILFFAACRYTMLYTSAEYNIVKNCYGKCKVIKMCYTRPYSRNAKQIKKMNTS